jgi:hypothetical protein
MYLPEIEASTVGKLEAIENFRDRKIPGTRYGRAERRVVGCVWRYPIGKRAPASLPEPFQIARRRSLNLCLLHYFL